MESSVCRTLLALLVITATVAQVVTAINTPRMKRSGYIAFPRMGRGYLAFPRLGRSQGPPMDVNDAWDSQEDSKAVIQHDNMMLKLRGLLRN